MRRVPVLPTLLVLAAVAVMVRLGFWQLDRLHQKEALLARYAAAQADRAEIAWPAGTGPHDELLFHRSRIDCRPTGPTLPMAGHNSIGTTGWAVVQSCALPGGSVADVVLGWSTQPKSVAWSGGVAVGMIAPGAGKSLRLIADPPLAGLQPNARPDPKDIPNNHLSYAVQWFLFALTALVIYALALRKRLAGA